MPCSENGSVEGVYTGDVMSVRGQGLAASEKAGAEAYNAGGRGKGLNAEHVYPQSMLKRAGLTDTARGDLHHILPARVGANRARSNLVSAPQTVPVCELWNYSRLEHWRTPLVRLSMA